MAVGPKFGEPAREVLQKVTVTGVKDLGGLQIQRCITVGQYLFREAWKILLMAAELHKFVMSP